MKRWRPKTHTFLLSVGEVTMTLEDVAHIFGLPINREPVSGWIDNSSAFLQSQSITIGLAPWESHYIACVSQISIRTQSFSQASDQGLVKDNLALE
ncbi:hypothetical protein AHAS_Ahas02G0172700 [Arachis hypogaea]